MRTWLKRLVPIAIVVPTTLAFGASSAVAAPPAYAIVENYGTCIRVLKTLGYDPTFSEVLTPQEFARAFDPLEINPSFPKSLSHKEVAVACDALYFFPR